MSRCAAVFALTAHGLARELHQNKALKPKALQSSQRAYQQPIASERDMAARGSLDLVNETVDATLTPAHKTLALLAHCLPEAPSIVMID